MENLQVTKVEFINVDSVEDRECICTLNNGTEVHIASCYESWEQWGGTTNELFVTMPIAERIDWLHGLEDEPDEWDLISLGLCEEDEDEY